MNLVRQPYYYWQHYYHSIVRHCCLGFPPQMYAGGGANGVITPNDKAIAAGKILCLCSFLNFFIIKSSNPT